LVALGKLANSGFGIGSVQLASKWRRLRALTGRKKKKKNREERKKERKKKENTSSPGFNVFYINSFENT
jgi:hypothetical protein